MKKFVDDIHHIMIENKKERGGRPSSLIPLCMRICIAAKERDIDKYKTLTCETKPACLSQAEVYNMRISRPATSALKSKRTKETTWRNI